VLLTADAAIWRELARSRIGRLDADIGVRVDRVGVSPSCPFATFVIVVAVAVTR
jgi:hypothetical protein